MTAVPMSTLNYQDWLPHWQSLTKHTSTNIVLVPPEACRVKTPLKAPAWSIYLRTYPHQELVQFFLRGITEGFRIGFNYHTQQLKSARKNLEGALSHPGIVQEYLQTEIHMGRLIGPLDNSFKLVTQISCFGVIPKSHQPGKWRLIVDLSHPVGFSMNDSIPKNLSSIKYTMLSRRSSGLEKALC